MIKFIIICLLIIIGILFLLFILHSLENADDAIEDKHGNIVKYKRGKK